MTRPTLEGVLPATAQEVSKMYKRLNYGQPMAHLTGTAACCFGVLNLLSALNNRERGLSQDRP